MKDKDSLTFEMCWERLKHRLFRSNDILKNNQIYRNFTQDIMIPIIKHIFLNFLKKEGCYDAFMENYFKTTSYTWRGEIWDRTKVEDKDLTHIFSVSCPGELRSLIGVGFSWAGSLQGERYWSTLYDKWSDIYEDIYKKNSIKEILKHHAKDTPKEFLAIVEECQC